MVPALNLEAWGEPIPANADGVAMLEETIASLREAPPAGPASPLPAIAETVSGTTYEMTPNPANWATLRFDIVSEKEIVVTAAFAGDPQPLVFTVGLDGVHHLASGQYGLPIAARGTWANENTFVIDLDFVANLNAFTIQTTFSGDAVALVVTDLESGAELPIEGPAAGEATPVS